MRLEVHQQRKVDIYRDIVRIPEEHRRDTQGRIVREGTIVKIIVTGKKSKVVWLRGIEGETRPRIQMDDKTRNDLELGTEQQYDFKIKSVGCYRKFRWAFDSSDPVVYIATWLGMISVALGLIGVLMAFIALLH